jgi:hypothetical protein
VVTPSVCHKDSKLAFSRFVRKNCTRFSTVKK